MSAALAPRLTLPQLAQFAGGDLIVRDVPRDPAARESLLRSGIGSVSIDTRTLEPGALFVPLPGAHVDGHAFLDEAFRRGAAAALCDRAHHAAIAGREPGPLVVVDDVTASLAAMARRHRQDWPGLLIGVTGSNGKTTTKDLVAAVLATTAPTLRTEGNLNNHWGVPLTLLRLDPEHRAAVVEMGMNHAGEIDLLCAIARPNAGLITNAGTAHLEHLGSLEAIAREKARLAWALEPGQPLFAGADSERLMQALAGAPCRVVPYGFAAGASLRPRGYEDLGPDGSRLDVDGFPPVHVRLPGRHHAANALGALAVAREFGVDPAAAAAAIAAYRPSRGRMETRTVRGATLLVDCYNASPESVRAALETLATWPASRRIALLGDMLELGADAPALHRATGAAVRGAELWAVGTHAGDWLRGAAEAGVASRRFDDKPAVARALAEALAPGVVVLIKASRGAALEQVVAALGAEG